MNVQQVMIAPSDGVGFGPRNLARVPDFDLGQFRVKPSSRLIEARDGTAVMLEPLAMQVLVALAEQDGRILTRDDLIAQCWGRRIVGDDAVNRIISRLRRKLETFTGPAVAVETIAKVGYRLKVADTPASVTLPPAPVRAPRRAAWKAVGLFALLTTPVALAGWTWSMKASAEQPVVIAFDQAGNAADAPSARFASDVWTDLAKLTGAKTRIAFVDGPAQVRGADLIARFSIARDGAALVSRARLVEARSGAVIWAQSYRDEKGLEEPLRQLTSVQMAGIMSCGMERAAGSFVAPVELRLYFGACDAATSNDWSRARAFAQEIVARRPDAAAGWSCLALTTIREADQAGTLDAAVMRRAKSMANRSLSLDRNSGLAYHALMEVQEIEGKPLLPLLRTAVAASPEDGWIHKEYARALFQSGYVADSVEPALRATALEPKWLDLRLAAVYALLSAGRKAEALAGQDEIERDWNTVPVVANAGIALLPYRPDSDAALAEARVLKGMAPAMQSLLVAELEWQAGGASFDRARFDRAAERAYAASPPNAWLAALIASRLGDEQRALAWLARGPLDAPKSKWSLLFRPEAAPLRRDPRFFAKMAQLGLVDLWRDQRRWPDFCSEKGLRYDCASEAARMADARSNRPGFRSRPNFVSRSGVPRRALPLRACRSPSRFVRTGSSPRRAAMDARSKTALRARARIPICASDSLQGIYA